jgi:sugar lactone lactonase YvrE
VIKFSPDGKELMRLGTAGKAGTDPGLLNEPCDVVTAANGDIFVADGHSGQNATPPPGTTGRIVKFSKDGRYITEWGHLGTAPGDFRTPHALAFDSRGRLFVGDRGNNRIQIFDQDGRLLEVWSEFGRPSGIYIDANDNLYTIDADTTATNHPGWSTGIRIGTAREDKVVAFIPPHKSANPWGAAGEGVLVDAEGTVYEAPGPASRPVVGGGLTRYLKR